MRRSSGSSRMGAPVLKEASWFCSLLEKLPFWLLGLVAISAKVWNFGPCFTRNSDFWPLFILELADSFEMLSLRAFFWMLWLSLLRMLWLSPRFEFLTE